MPRPSSWLGSPPPSGYCDLVSRGAPQVDAWMQGPTVERARGCFIPLPPTAGLGGGESHPSCSFNGSSGSRIAPGRGGGERKERSPHAAHGGPCGMSPRPTQRDPPRTAPAGAGCARPLRGGAAPGPRAGLPAGTGRVTRGLHRGSRWGRRGGAGKCVGGRRHPPTPCLLPAAAWGPGPSPCFAAWGWDIPPRFGAWGCPPPPTPTRVPWLVLVGDHEGEGDFCPGGQLHVPGHRGEHPGRRRGGRRRPQKGERCFPPCAERPQSHHVPGGLQGPTRGTWRWPQRGVGMRGLCAQWGASVGPRSHPSTPGCCGGGGIHTPQSSPRLSWKTCRPQNK